MACLQEVDRQGYVETTVADIIKTAAVSRRTFYEHFESKEACFLATYDAVFAALSEAALDAYASAEGAWPPKVRVSIDAFLVFLAKDSRLANFCMV